MAWPVSGNYETRTSLVTTVKKAWADALDAALNGLYGGTKTVKLLTVDGVGYQSPPALATDESTPREIITAGANVWGPYIKLDDATSTAQVSVYRNANGLLGIVINAYFRVSDSKWVQYDGAKDSYMQRMSPAGGVVWQYKVAGAAAWVDGGWGTLHTFNSAGDSTTLGNFVTALGDLQANHIIGNGGTPTKAAGLGQGNAPVDGDVTVAGNDTDGVISVLASAGVAAGTVCTITFNKTFGGVIPRICLTPNNAAAADLATQPYAQVTGGPPYPSWRIVTSATSLVNGTTYLWSYHVAG